MSKTNPHSAPSGTSRSNLIKESLYKLIPVTVRQAHHNQNKLVTIHSESVGGLNQRFNPTSSLAIAIAATLSGYLISASPVQAKFNAPSDLPPSPLCIAGQCALPFEDKMLVFDEFGTKPYSSSTSASNSHPFPIPADCTGMAGDSNKVALKTFGTGLDNFLKEDLYSAPTRTADETARNPWEAMVIGCLPATAGMIMPADGRPTGEDFAHQRWDEFPTKEYFQTAMSGARVNGGLRDKQQLHGYSKGEFRAPDPSINDPGGLYYLDADNDGHGGSEGLVIKMNHNLPTQSPQSVWTFDGTLPPKLLMARYGQTILFRHYNALPINTAANAGFGKNTITTHEHNGHNPAESDGFAHAYFYPGQFYDYHWPMVLAGYDSINTNATDYRTGAPAGDGHGGVIKVRGDWQETMSTHWFHDHMLDYTAQNVYKGNAAMMNYYSALDSGREPKSDAEAKGSSATPGYGCNYKALDSANPGANNVNLCLPSGSSMDWGNRDYDVNLVVADKAWDNAGQLKFNIFNTNGFLGDRITVNWLYKPYMDVRARRYRFRILNGSVSRFYKIAIVQERDLTDTQCKSASSTIILAPAIPGTPPTATTPAIDPTPKKCYEKITYHMIANDGNLMKYAVPFPNVQSLDALPEQGIAERYDIIVDFKPMKLGTKVYFVNILEHQDGQAPSKILALSDVLSAKYKADGINGDPVVGKFLELRVKGCGPNSDSVCDDFSMNPVQYVEGVQGAKQMIPPHRATAAELQGAINRTFVFGKKAVTDATPWTIKVDTDPVGLNADMNRVSAAPVVGATEIWHISGGQGWSHPVHIHFEEGQILKRGGVAPPIWEKYARKDVYRIGGIVDSTSSVDIALKFREFAGTYVEHCHNTQHEDKAMLLRWDLEHPGQTQAIQTPEPDWDGVKYIPSIYGLTAKAGDVDAKKKFVVPVLP